MTERKEYFRCPDGTVTDDMLAYAVQWRKLGEFAEQMFPGYVVRAYDPHVSLVCTDRTSCDDYLVLSPKALVALKRACGEPMKFKIPYWTVTVSGGDGSAYVKYFTSEKKAQAYADLEDEPFCEAVSPPREVELDPKHYKDES